MLYLGMAGAIADYQIGDVVIPNEFVDRHNNAVSFEKNFARAFLPDAGKHWSMSTQTKSRVGYNLSLMKLKPCSWIGRQSR